MPTDDRRNGLALEDASAELQDDREIVTEAIKQNVDPLVGASTSSVQVQSRTQTPLSLFNQARGPSQPNPQHQLQTHINDALGSETYINTV